MKRQAFGHGQNADWRTIGRQSN